MTKLSDLPAVYLVGGLAVLAALWWVTRPGNAQALGVATGGAAVDMATGLLTGTVQGVGGAVGVPATSLSECERAKADGRTWDASFACPAGDFLSYWWNK